MLLEESNVMSHRLIKSQMVSWEWEKHSSHVFINIFSMMCNLGIVSALFCHWGLKDTYHWRPATCVWIFIQTSVMSRLQFSIWAQSCILDVYYTVLVSTIVDQWDFTVGGTIKTKSTCRWGSNSDLVNEDPLGWSDSHGETQVCCSLTLTKMWDVS